MLSRCEAFAGTGLSRMREAEGNHQPGGEATDRETFGMEEEDAHSLPAACPGVQIAARRAEVAAGLLFRLHGLKKRALRKDRVARSDQCRSARDAAGGKRNG